MSSSKTKITLKKLKELDTIWHPESTLVFKSQNEKIVIGTYDGKFVPLDQTAVELCEKWKFKYDKSLLEEEEEEVEEVEEKEESEEEENEKEESEEEENEKEEVIPVVKEDGEVIQVVKEEIVNIQNNSNTNNHLRDITETFSNNLYKFYDDLKLENTKEITELQNKLCELTKKYDLEVKNHDDAKDKLSKLQTKFDTMKQFFSV